MSSISHTSISSFSLKLLYLNERQQIDGLSLFKLCDTKSKQFWTKECLDEFEKLLIFLRYSV